MRGIDAEPGQLGADETPEGIVTHPRGAGDGVSQAGDRDRDIGRRAAEELTKPGDVLQRGVHLQRVQVDAAPTDGADIEYRLIHGDDSLNGGLLTVCLHLQPQSTYVRTLSTILMPSGVANLYDRFQAIEVTQTGTHCPARGSHHGTDL